MGTLIPKPPITQKQKEHQFEYIEQHHFVKSSEKQAITKHVPIEEPITAISGSVSIGEVSQMITYKPTHSYDPYTFTGPTIEQSIQGIEKAIENGKDTDMITLSVGDIRRMQERIRLLEKTIMKPQSAYQSSTLLEAERARIHREHAMETELRRTQIQLQQQNHANQIDRMRIMAGIK